MRRNNFGAVNFENIKKKMPYIFFIIIICLTIYIIVKAMSKFGKVSPTSSTKAETDAKKFQQTVDTLTVIGKNYLANKDKHGTKKTAIPNKDYGGVNMTKLDMVASNLTAKKALISKIIFENPKLTSAQKENIMNY